MDNCMQKLSITKWLFLVFLAGICTSSQAQKFLTPDDVTLQYGGSIGYLNLSAGYKILKEKGSLNFGYGFVPKSKGGRLHMATAKIAYRPFNIPIKDWAVIRPLNPGFFITYDFGGDFTHKRDESQFSKGYYWWNSAIRPHLSFSNEISLNSRKALPDSKIKNVTLYSEFNTNDLYVVSWVVNRKTISPGDIFKLGLGVKVHF